MRLSSLALLWLLWCWLLSAPLIQAQSVADSLIGQLPSTKADTNRLNLYANIFKNLLFSKPTEGLYYAQRFDTLAKQLKNRSEMARGRNFIGMAQYTLGNYDRAVQYYLEALRQYEALHDSLYMGIVMNNLAACYQHRNRPDQTIAYYEKALGIFEQINDKQWIGNVLTNLSAEYLKNKQPDKTLRTAFGALRIYEQLKDRYSMGLSYITIGNAYADKHRHHLAIDYFKRSLPLISHDYDPVAVGIAYENMGGSQIELKEYGLALQNLQKAIALFEKHDSPEHLKPSLKALALLHEKKGDFAQAYAVQSRYLALSDSLFNKEKDAAMLDALNRYEAEKKEQTIALLNSQNQVKDLQIREKQRQQGLFVGGLLALAVVVGVLGWLYRERQRTSQQLAAKNEIISKSLADKEVLLREIHHRVKNNLQVVSSLLSLQSRHIADETALEALNEGRNRVKSMALIHQNLYQEDNLTGIDVQAYVRNLCESLFNSYNIEPKRISLQTDIEPLQLDVDTVIPIGLILNELITNSLKYAFPNERTGVLSVRLKHTPGVLLLEVSDDGVGTGAPFDWQKTSSMGFQLIRSFAQKLKARVEVLQEQGFAVRLHIGRYEHLA